MVTDINNQTHPNHLLTGTVQNEIQSEHIQKEKKKPPKTRWLDIGISKLHAQTTRTRVHLEFPPYTVDRVDQVAHGQCQRMYALHLVTIRSYNFFLFTTIQYYDVYSRLVCVRAIIISSSDLSRCKCGSVCVCVCASTNAIVHSASVYFACTDSVHKSGQ